MQLLVLALLLMTAGKSADLKNLQPILESLGGEQASGAIKRAEELSGMLEAFRSVAGVTDRREPMGEPSPSFEETADGTDGGGSGFPLAPVASIADDNIKYCLSRYIALGE